MVARGELSLSFLDVLSCGLGAMLILFFIFATFDREGATDPSQSTAARAVTAALVDSGEGEETCNRPVLWQMVVDSRDFDTSEPLVSIPVLQLSTDSPLPEVRVSRSSNHPNTFYIRFSSSAEAFDPQAITFKSQGTYTVQISQLDPPDNTLRSEITVNTAADNEPKTLNILNREQGITLN